MQTERRVQIAVHRRILFILALAAGASLSSAQAAPQATAQADEAFTLEQQGKFDEAEAAWRAVAKQHPSIADPYAHLGFLEARQEHYREAVPLYRKALAINPSMPGLRLNLGLALFKAGEMKDAAQTFLPLLRTVQPSSPDAQRLNILVGMAYYGAGEFAAAVPYLSKVIASDPQDLHYRLVLAHSCLAAHQYPCVLDVYKQILALNAESAEADMLAGEALDEMRDHGAAIEQFRAAVKADPHQPNVHFGLGYLLWTQNQFDEATQQFQAELEMAPNNAEAMTFLADCRMHAGSADEARPLLDKAVALDGTIERAHLDLAILNAQDNRQSDAIREFKIAEKLDPSDSDVHWRLARLYRAMGRKEEAKAEFDKTSSLHKAENESVFSKLKAAQDKGQPSDAAQGSSTGHTR